MSSRVEIIAELSTNHGGDVGLALQFIKAFSPIVDTIKIQSHRVAHLQPTDPQFEWMRSSQLKDEHHFKILGACQDAGVQFLTTIFNTAEVDLVARLGCQRVKIGSGEAGNVELAKAVHAAGLRALVSTGITPVGMTAFEGYRYRQFLGCVTRYPAPAGIAYAMLTNNPQLSGFSDHSIGLDECKAAIVAGAKIIECHVQLPNQARPVRSFEKSVAAMRELRDFADDDTSRFIKRWQS